MTVVPKLSEFFGSYLLGNMSVLVPYNEQPLYIEDWIGLRFLDEQHRVFFQVRGKHTRMHTCTHAHAHMYMHTCTHAHAHMYMQTHTCKHTHAHMHTCTHVHAHTFFSHTGFIHVSYFTQVELLNFYVCVCLCCSIRLAGTCSLPCSTCTTRLWFRGSTTPSRRVSFCESFCESFFFFLFLLRAEYSWQAAFLK